MKTTHDGILNRTITLEQPAEGYRVAIDTILLASAVPAEAGQTALDLGCGVGGVMLALARRVANISVTGLEIQPELVDLCQKNIDANGFSNKLRVLCGDATALPSSLRGIFDHVMINPPYHDGTRHDASPNKIKKIANTEEDGDLPLWISSAFAALKENSVLTLIHRADRWDEIQPLLEKRGTVEVIPLLPKTDAQAKRIIIRVRCGSSCQTTHASPLVLHNADGSYTEQAENILRHLGSV